MPQLHIAPEGMKPRSGAHDGIVRGGALSTSPWLWSAVLTNIVPLLVRQAAA